MMQDDGRTGGGAQAMDGGVATAGGAVVGQWQDPGCCRTPGVMSLLHALGHRQVGMAPGVWARGAGLEAYLGQGWAVPAHACGAGQRNVPTADALKPPYVLQAKHHSAVRATASAKQQQRQQHGKRPCLDSLLYSLLGGLLNGGESGGRAG